MILHQGHMNPQNEIQPYEEVYLMSPFPVSVYRAVYITLLRINFQLQHTI